MHTSTGSAPVQTAGSTEQLRQPVTSRPTTRASASAEFADFCRQVRPRLDDYLMKKTRSAEDARDICQEVFARAWARWDTVARLDQPAAWAFTVANNLLTDAWRRDQRRHAAAAVAPRAGGGGDADRADVLVVREAVLGLPPDVRDAVLLYYFEDWTLSRIAAAAGVPPATVKHRLHRGRRVLRSRLDEPESAGSAADSGGTPVVLV